MNGPDRTTCRLIACLDVLEGRVVKGVRFEQLQDCGDPVELARRYADEGIDELSFLDIGATPASRQSLFEVLERVARELFIPLSAGGGLRTVADMVRMLSSGADKVVVGSAALARPELLGEAAERLGSQAVVLSLDARSSGPGTWEARACSGRSSGGRDALDWVREAVARGAGEILVNSIDRDGTRTGFDLELTRAVSRAVPVPVIASGGGGTLAHLVEALREGEADAVLVASLLHRDGVGVQTIKNYLREQGVNVR